MKWFLLCALLCPAVSGCRTFSWPADSEALQGSTWLEYDATRRGGFLLDKKDDNGNKTGRVLIAENSPDVASSISAELVAKTKDVEISGKLTESLLELGKRTETVMILRESLYRLAELTNNVNLTAEQSTALYTRVLNAITVLSLAEHATSQAEIARAIADAVRSANGADGTSVPPSTDGPNPGPTAGGLEQEVDGLRETLAQIADGPSSEAEKRALLTSTDHIRDQVRHARVGPALTARRDRALGILADIEGEIRNRPEGQPLERTPELEAAAARLADAVVGIESAGVPAPEAPPAAPRGESARQTALGIARLNDWMSDQQKLLRDVLEIAEPVVVVEPD